MHKFSIYPARFGELLCTGCGRCSRALPRRHGPPGGPPDDRGTSRRTRPEVPREPLRTRTCVRVDRPRRRDARHPDAPPRLPGPERRPDVRLQGGPVRRVLGVRRRASAPSASPPRPTRKGYIECSFKTVGKATTALRSLERGRHDGLPRPVRQPLPAREDGRQEPGLHRGRHRPRPRALRHLERPRPARPLRRRDDRLRRALGRRPRLQARARRVGRAPRRDASADGRPRRRDARLDGRGRLRPHDRREGRAVRRRTPSPSSAARRS